MIAEEEFEALETTRNTLDLLCPQEQFAAEDVLATCQAFIEKQQSFTEDIAINIETACRGFCPLDGSCICGYRETASLAPFSSFAVAVPDSPAEQSTGSTTFLVDFGLLRDTTFA